ncbi:hypothetical protein PTKIN_Ptkin12aG0194800 [Pterospermum kingtungense]
MDFLSTIFLLIALPLLFLLSILCFRIIKIFTAQFINNANYAPVKGTFLNQLFHQNNLYDYHTRIAEKLPTFTFIYFAENLILTADTRNVEHILKTKFDKYVKGEHFGEVFGDLLGEGILAVDGDKWRQQRKLASYEFSTRALRDISFTVFRRNGAKLVRQVSECAMSGQVIEFQDMMMEYMMKSILEVGFGIDLNSMYWSSKDEETSFVKAFDDSLEAVKLRFINPLWKLKKSLNIGSEAPLKKNLKLVHNVIDNFISIRKKQLAMNPDGNMKEDILSRFLAQSEKSPETMTDNYLKDIIMSFLTAKDGTTSAFSWFFYLICKNPLIQEKVAQEVIDVTSTCKENYDGIDDFMTTMTDAALEKMHYLHAALTETLRLYPPIPEDGRIAVADDILPDGHKVKKGDKVLYMAYSMGRLPYIWGEDAENFRPERWLKDGVFQAESPFKFISFHAGPRICLGKDFAFRQLKMFSAALIRHFRFKLVDDTKDAAYKVTIALMIKGGLHLCAVPRTT